MLFDWRHMQVQWAESRLVLLLHSMHALVQLLPAPCLIAPGPNAHMHACSAAFSIRPEPSSTLARRMEAAALQQSAGSKANGALMRVTPLVIWATAGGLSAEQVADLAAADARLNHPNQASVHYACTVKPNRMV